MLKVITASTTEIDEPEDALAEILKQIDVKNGLLANAVGIVTCYYEFIVTGVLEELRKNLPFEVIGCTALGSATNNGYSMEQLSLTVLTSDEIRFATSISPEISKGNTDAPLQEAWRQGRAKLPGDPGLIIAFAPIMSDISGDYMLRKLDEICGGLPIFGTLSNDSSPNFQESRTFLNGEVHQGKIALLQLYGPVKPRFFVSSVSIKNIHHQKALVTESDGYFIKKVNNLTFIDYLASIGVRKETLDTLTTLPFMVDYGDGTPPVALAIYSILPEGALCGGEIPSGAGITFTEIDYNSVMDTAADALGQALDYAEKNGANGILAIPCMTRSLMIMPNSEDEMLKTFDAIGRKLPFMLFYSGGEICPLYNKEGVAVNRFHNYTYTLVVL
ncbi:MAG: FIST C-terminal domain-containing protein [Desulfovibrionaceae bacterium]|nr:FIST C-terminal domain-containing protein [Desulfovibrionaceae bacterium]